MIDMTDPSQRDIVDFLSSPAAHDGAPAERIDTHLSHVFLAGARVYKIKRAVRYDFADFSTLALRRRACENEVRVNRRTAPAMYRRAVPLYRSETGVAWRGSGEPVEWAVEMARFAAADRFDILLADGKLGAPAVKELADRIAAFHQDAERKTDFRPGGGVARTLDQLSAALHGAGLGGTRERDIARWTAIAFADYEKNARLLETRRRFGWARHCHGDLHLGNICLFNGAPTPFDAIEFNDDLSDIDVLYDLAFVLMDFTRRGRGDLACLLRDRYLSATRDYAGLALLPLFQSMRAAVRAMVSGLPGQPAAAASQADGYLDLALDFLTPGAAPAIIAVGGYSATGKSTLARRLSLALKGATVMRSDVVRKRMKGRAPEERLAEAHYAPGKTGAVYRRLFKDARRALRAGAPVILDATFLDEPLRAGAEDAARRAGVAFHGLWLTGPRDVLADRIVKRSGGASDATLGVLEKQLAHAVEPQGWGVIDAGSAPDDVFRQALKQLETAPHEQ